MLSSSIPTKFPIAFAGGGSALKNTIPEASQIGVTAGAASLTDGFPPLTMQPIVSGGVPPFGQDMNGILFQVTNVARWINAGGSFAYDAAFAADANVNGYMNGSVLQAGDKAGFWLSTGDNNTFDPDNSVSCTATISTTNMTVSAVASGVIKAGMIITGNGVTAGTSIVSQTSGTTGGAGVYVVSISQTVGSATTMTMLPPNWVPSYNYGITTISGLTSSNLTLSSTQAAKKTIILTGTLTGNIILTFPVWKMEWTVVNNTTGNFTISGIPLAGTGVFLPQGYSTKIYCDGTNIYGAVTGHAQNVSFNGNQIINSVLKQTGEVRTSQAAAATTTLDLSTANVFDVSLGAAITTLSITNAMPSGTAHGFSLIFTANGTGYAVTWPASVKWAGGTAPTLTITNAKQDVFTFLTRDGGTTWLAFVAGQNI